MLSYGPSCKSGHKGSSENANIFLFHKALQIPVNMRFWCFPKYCFRFLTFALFLSCINFIRKILIHFDNESFGFDSLHPRGGVRRQQCCVMMAVLKQKHSHFKRQMMVPNSSFIFSSYFHTVLIQTISLAFIMIF